MAFNRGGRSGGSSGYRGGSSGGFRKSFGPREMHKIKCSECGKESEVPFKPSGDRPVYCKDCFLKKKGITPREEEKEETTEEATEESDKDDSEEEDSEEKDLE